MQEPFQTKAQQHLDLFRVTAADLSVIQMVGAEMLSALGTLKDWFYDWLRTQPEFELFLSDPVTLERVKAAQVGYWAEFIAGQVDDDYIESRVRIGQTHARIGLSLRIYSAAMNTFVSYLFRMVDDTSFDEDVKAHAKEAISKLSHMDMAIASETIATVMNERVAAQNRMLMELSTPVAQIWRGILLLPVVGMIDSKRAQDIMTAVLNKIAETEARVFILDISGVGIVDTAVANHLIKITRSTRMMGCESTISGVSPAVARTIVDLGIDVSGIQTIATLRGALANAFEHLQISTESSNR
jgi:rsbT co-antagonist protein RsbR